MALRAPRLQDHITRGHRAAHRLNGFDRCKRYRRSRYFGLFFLLPKQYAYAAAAARQLEFWKHVFIVINLRHPIKSGHICGGAKLIKIPPEDLEQIVRGVGSVAVWLFLSKNTIRFKLLFTISPAFPVAGGDGVFHCALTVTLRTEQTIELDHFYYIFRLLLLT